MIKQNARGTAGDNRFNCNRIPRAAVYDIPPTPPGDSAGQKIALIATARGSTGHLWGESTGDRWIPSTSDAELWCFLWFAPEQTAEESIETPVIWDAIVLIMTLL